MKLVISIPLDLNVKCRGNCSNCKWNLKPSKCEPMNQATIDAGVPASKRKAVLGMIDQRFGVADKVIEDDD